MHAGYCLRSCLHACYGMVGTVHCYLPLGVKGPSKCMHPCGSTFGCENCSNQSPKPWHFARYTIQFTLVTMVNIADKRANWSICQLKIELGMPRFWTLITRQPLSMKCSLRASWNETSEQPRVSEQHTVAMDGRHIHQPANFKEGCALIRIHSYCISYSTRYLSGFRRLIVP